MLGGGGRVGRGVLPLVDDSLDIMLPSYRSPRRSLCSLLRRLWLMYLETHLHKYRTYSKSMGNYLQGQVEVSTYQGDSYSNVLSLALRLGFLLLQSRGMSTQLGFDNEVVLLRNRLVCRVAVEVLVSFIAKKEIPSRRRGTYGVVLCVLCVPSAHS